jgi:muramoyltetrapeptide carboxypeptidase
MSHSDLHRPSRRRALAALAAACALPPAFAAAPSGLIRPRRLRRGDLVGLIAPGGAMEDAGLQKCVANLESLGLRVKPAANLRAQNGMYAGTVGQRLADLHAMVADPEVSAIWAARGGQGCIALLPLIDYALVRANPKILVGYSDITALHLAWRRQANLVSFHGPVAWSTFTPYSVEHLQRTLMEPLPYTIRMAAENAAKAIAGATQFEARAVNHGIVEGPLVGGNLSLVSALAGTPYAADFRGALGFIEEIEEAPHRVARMMAQLAMGERGEGLAACAGLMLGVLDQCEGKPGYVGPALRPTLDELMAPLPMPSVAGYSFGHIAHQFTLPVGVRARLDTYNQTLTLLEGGVV